VKAEQQGADPDAGAEEGDAKEGCEEASRSQDGVADCLDDSNAEGDAEVG
jgi:hypothetical protein